MSLETIPLTIFVTMGLTEAETVKLTGTLTLAVTVKLTVALKLSTWKTLEGKILDVLLQNEV